MWTRSELRGADLRWMLVLTIRGELYRFSTTTLDVDDGERSLLFRAGLSPMEFPDTIAPPGGTVQEPSARAELRFTRNTAAGWAALNADDLDLGDLSAELSMHIVGQDWSRRRVVLSGPVVSADGGALDEPVSLGLTEAPWRRQAGSLPRDSYRVSDSTFTSSTFSIGDGIAKLFYPEVVGAPGYRDPSSGSTYPAVPALLAAIDTSDLNNSINPAEVVIGAGSLRTAGVADSIKLFNATTEASAVSFTPSVQQDDQGQSYTSVSVDDDASGGLDIADGDELWIHFTTPAFGGRADTNGGTLRSADEVIRWLVESSGVRSDTDSLAADLRWLRGVQLDFYVNESLDPIDDLLLGQLVPLFPIATRIGPDGLAFSRWPYDATADDAIAHLDITNTTGHRAGSVSRSDPGEVINLQTINYAKNGRTDSYLGEFTFAPTKRVDQTDREVHPYSAASGTRYGERVGELIETDLIVSRDAAVFAVNWRIRYYSQTREAVTFLLPQEWQAIPTGEVITVTAPDIGWDARVCVVRGVLLREGPTELALETVPDFIRDARR